MGDEEINQLLNDLESGAEILQDTGLLSAADLLSKASKTITYLRQNLPLNETQKLATSNPPEKQEAQFILTIMHLVKRNLGTTECCGKTLFELPRTDRVTIDPDIANCPGVTS